MVAFDWNAANEAHVARHGVSPDEVEQVILGNPIEYGVEHRKGELRLSFVGATESGRLLFVVVTKRGNAIRVVTAYPAQPKMKSLYETMRGEKP